MTFLFLLIIFIKVLNEEVVGNLILMYGCNNYYQLGRTYPTGACTETSNTTIMLGKPEFLQNEGLLYNKNIKRVGVTSHNTVVLTSDNDIFVIGEKIDFLHDENIDTSQPLPVKLLSSSVEIIDLKCSEYSCFYKDINNTLWGWGRNNYDHFGIGDIPLDIITPIKIMDNVTHHKCVNNVQMISNDSKNVYVAGRQTNKNFGIGNENVLTIDTFTKIHMDRMENETSKIRDIHLTLYATFILYENNRLYGFGNFKEKNFLTTSTGYELEPIFLDIYTPLGGIPKDVDTIYGFYTGKWVNVLIMPVYNIFLGRIQNQFTWGDPYEADLGRDLINDSPSYPFLMRRGDIDEEEEIIDCQTSFVRSSVNFLTDKGRVYGFGSNWNYENTDIYDKDESTSKPFQKTIHTDITYLPPHIHQHTVFVKSSYRCNDKIPISVKKDVCNERGTCISENFCKCLNNYFGSDCEVSKCFEKLSNETGCCSNHGTCSSNNNCICDPGYIKYDCSIPICSGKIANESDVCNNHECILHDECLCEDPYYGIDCQEIIYHAFFTNIQNSEFSINYQIPISLIPSKMIEKNFKCDIIFENENQIGEALSCSFGFKSDEVSEIIVRILGEVYIKNNDRIIFKPLTKPWNTTTIIVFPFKFFEMIISNWVIFFFIPTLIIIFLIIIIVSLICVFVIRKQKKRLKKFGQLKDFDLILAEQKAERGGVLEHINVNKKLFEIDYKQIVLCSELGSGGSGAIIYHAKWKNKDVALKVFRTKDLSSHHCYDDFEKEINFLSSVNFPNIVQFYGACITSGRVMIVFEYCENSNLKSYISLTGHNSEKRKLTLQDKLRICYELALSIAYLHERKIIHRDIKSENLLLDKNLCSKLIDFGFSKIIDERNIEGMTRNVGTRSYMAPEVLVGQKNYDGKVDIYSYGIFLFEIMTENFNPYGENIPNLDLQVANDENFRPKIDESKYPDLKWYIDLMKKCWFHSSTKRPPVKEIIKIFENQDIDLNLIKKKDDEIEIKDDKLQEYKNKILDILSNYKKKLDEYSLPIFEDTLNKIEQLENE